MRACCVRRCVGKETVSCEGECGDHNTLGTRVVLDTPESRRVVLNTPESRRVVLDTPRRVTSQSQCNIYSPRVRHDTREPQASFTINSPRHIMRETPLLSPRDLTGT